jgi:hypothetical protein
MTDISGFPAIMLLEKATVQPFSIQAIQTSQQDVLGRTNHLLYSHMTQETLKMMCPTIPVSLPVYSLLW